MGAVYCRLVANIMADLGLDSVACYLDNVLIHTREMDEHLNVIDQVLRAHLEAGIRLKPSKTLFFQEKVDFLGFEGLGLASDQLKLISNRLGRCSLPGQANRWPVLSVSCNTIESSYQNSQN